MKHKIVPGVLLILPIFRKFSQLRKLSSCIWILMSKLWKFIDFISAYSLEHISFQLTLLKRFHFSLLSWKDFISAYSLEKVQHFLTLYYLSIAILPGAIFFQFNYIEPSTFHMTFTAVYNGTVYNFNKNMHLRILVMNICRFSMYMTKKLIEEI